MSYVPLMPGAKSYILIVPLEENCPITISMKYIGFPTKSKTIKYGMTKAPPPFSNAAI